MLRRTVMKSFHFTIFTVLSLGEYEEEEES